MATGTTATSRRSPAQTAALARLSASMYRDTLDIFKELVKAGRSNLMQGYASSILIADFMHSAGITTDGAYQQVNALSTLFDVTQIGAGVFGTLFGNSALQPTLRTAMDASDSSDEDDGDDGGDTAAKTLETATKALTTVAEVAAAVA